MCLLLSLLLAGPRFVLVIWWLLEPVRWSATFNDSVLIPLLGLFFLPWTTLMFVLVAPQGVVGLDWAWLALAVFGDVASYGSSAVGGRGRVPGGYY